MKLQMSFATARRERVSIFPILTNGSCYKNRGTSEKQFLLDLSEIKTREGGCRRIEAVSHEAHHASHAFEKRAWAVRGV